MSGVVRWLAAAMAVAATMAFLSPPVDAEPVAASGYRVAVVKKPGANFAGLAQDGDALLVTDLAAGRFYRISGQGAFEAFGPILPHGVDVIGDPTGPYHVFRHGSGYLVAQGWTPNGAEETPYDHAILEIDAEQVTRILRSDFLNPYAAAIDGDTLYVVDAARNSVERLSLDGRTKSTLLSFARLEQPQSAMQQLSPTEFGSEGTYAFDAVPTGIAVTGDRLHISLFGGFPFLEGSGVIVSLDKAAPSPRPRIDVRDLNCPVDVDFDADGRMLVLEHGLYRQEGGFVAGSGRLLGVDVASGKRDVLVDGLTRPVALVVTGPKRIVISALDGTLTYLERGN